MVVIEVESPDAFDAIFTSHHGLILALFTGSNDESGQNWCPDCVAADPYIHAAIASHEDTVLLHCPVGPKDSWRGQPGHPYRTMLNTKVKCVPTLIRYQDHREVARLEEGRLLNSDILNEFFS